MEKAIANLLGRCVNEVIDKEHLSGRLKKGEVLRVKLGIDPTSPNIHLGRAVLLWKLRDFQEMGHQVVFIVGDFTGLIGDTSDKDSERPMLGETEVKNNMRTYLDQAFKILDSKKTEVHYNSTWLSSLGFQEIGKMADLFGLHEFEAREVISKRLKAGKRVSLREILYPLMQGYDSVAVKADVELGGTDQRFNLITGRVIQPMYNQEPQDIIMTDLLEGTDGRKMSSSWGNVINVNDEPDDMFGKVMSIGDDLIIKYFKFATRISEEKIKEFEQNLNDGGNPRDIKKILAKGITELYHGPELAKAAEERFEKVFSKKELPDDLEEVSGNGYTVIDFISAWQGISKSESKSLVNQGAVSINGAISKKWDQVLERGDTVKVGPRKFSKVV